MKRRMKRLLALGIGILMIGVSACGSRTPADTGEEPKTEQTDQGSSTKEQEEPDETDNGETEEQEKEPETEDPENSETENNKADPGQPENTGTQPADQNTDTQEKYQNVVKAMEEVLNEK